MIMITAAKVILQLIILLLLLDYLNINSILTVRKYLNKNFR